jgi:hypothetical protein
MWKVRFVGGSPELDSIKGEAFLYKTSELVNELWQLSIDLEESLHFLSTIIHNWLLLYNLNVDNPLLVRQFAL